MAKKEERRQFFRDAMKAGGAAGLAAMALAAPSAAQGGKIEKTPAGLRVGNLIFTSGLAAPREGGPDDFGGSVEEQTHNIMKKHKENLEAAGSSLDNVLKVTVYMADIKVEKPAMNKAYASYFSGSHHPSRSAIGIEFPDSKTKVEIDMIAWVP